MCGIFGIINYGQRRYLSELDHIKEMISKLLTVSEQRGTDASGICVISEGKAKLFKDHVRGSDLISAQGYKTIMDSINYANNFKFMIGHTRARTKGSEKFNVNNHPIVCGKVIGVHNGVISNDDYLFDLNKALHRQGRVDSEIIFALLDKAISSDKVTITFAVRQTIRSLLGSYSCAFLHLDHPNYITLFTSSYSNIVLHDFNNYRLMVFGSSDNIIRKAGADIPLFKNPTSKREIGKNIGCRINTTNGKIYTFQLNEPANKKYSKHL